MVESQEENVFLFMHGCENPLGSPAAIRPAPLAVENPDEYGTEKNDRQCQPNEPFSSLLEQTPLGLFKD